MGETAARLVEIFCRPGANRKGDAPVPSRPGKQLPNLPERETPVFFVVGHGKSGTTWVRNVLDAHSEILCRGEGRLFGRELVQGPHQKA